MMRRFTPAAARAAGTLLAAALLAAALPATVPDGRRWWSYVQYLADDKLEGRNTGSAGHRKAADYVAAEFERAGLKPAGIEGYIQPVRFLTRRLKETESSLTLVRNGESEELVLGEDAIIGTRKWCLRGMRSPFPKCSTTIWRGWTCAARSCCT